MLRHDQELAIGIEKILIVHGACCQQQVARHTDLRVAIPGRGYRVKTAHKAQLLGRQRNRSPPQLPNWKPRLLTFGGSAKQFSVGFYEASRMFNGWVNP